MTHPVTAPIVVVNGTDCAFYRSVADALDTELPSAAKVYDATGRRLVVRAGSLQAGLNADGADELADILRAWLAGMDALRESTTNWTLDLLVSASVDHLGFS